MFSKLIKNKKDAIYVENYFNRFHDAFLKSAKVVSGNKFVQGAPWEPKRKYSNNESRLLDTGLMFFGKIGMFLELKHYNYNWPNEPSDRTVHIYLKSIADINPELFIHVGLPIIEINFKNISENKFDVQVKLELSLQDNPPDDITINCCKAEQIYLREA